MTNDNQKRLDKKFENNGWSRMTSNPYAWKDKHNNVVVKQESAERFNWPKSGTTTGYVSTSKKAGQ
jgi:hypothetical protein